MRCKIFVGYSAYKMQSEINEWLESEPMYFHEIHQSESPACAKDAKSITITIWYDFLDDITDKMNAMLTAMEREENIDEQLSDLDLF